MKFLLLYLLLSFSYAVCGQQIPLQKARLGEIHFGNRAGGTVGQEGPTEVFQILEQGSADSLISIRVNYDHIVKAIECCTAKKGCRTMGNPTALWSPYIRLRDGQKLVGISGAAGWFIDNLRFHFSDGSVSETFGGEGGDLAFKFLLNQDQSGQFKGEFIGFWGSYTHSLESLGLLFWPIE